jgi:hypothetical protein
MIFYEFVITDNQRVNKKDEILLININETGLSLKL